MSTTTDDSTVRGGVVSRTGEVLTPKRHRGQLAARIVVGAGMAFILAYCLAPFYWMVVSSLRRPSEGRSTQLIPCPLSVENYIAVFAPGNHFTRSLLNSLIVAGGTTALVVALGVLGAYALARLDFRGKVAVMFLIVATSMFPVITLVVPLLKLFTGGYDWFPWNWINTYQAMILPSISFALPLAVWNLNAYFRQLPVELEQAAMVDGTTRMGAFFRVILPLAVPGIFTTAIITFIAAWNEFLIALTMVNDPLMQTANVAISKFTGISGYDTPYGTKMAAGVIVTIPLIIVVLLFQRRIIGGLAAGSVK
ncbi:carbohydrate ABC transporter permease [Brachybacterium aquaticum]|uniref:Multiple sugar transport system permease protein n=1 Tax=Brachybacterium aquaticum TaxID=1432564 RepID=A0A841A5J6_9MICO|nr:carbohydrate ABC transporter permease [Brachybacterium aquaticum]MBB5830409.1 multiple sugar transport system permease protein [Brachybacterium aquaticum]